MQKARSCGDATAAWRARRMPCPGHRRAMGFAARVRRFSSFGGTRAVAAALMLLSLFACSSYSEQGAGPAGQKSLEGNLSIASAAMAAGQPDVARRLYRSLSERYEDAPEPVMGLGYIALQNNDYNAAHGHFVRAAELAKGAPEEMAEALLGAGRAALARGKTGTARKHLSKARKLAREPSTRAWIENGLAVAAVLEGNYGNAEEHYAEALRHSSAHPRITANYLRMLVASGRTDEAKRIFDDHDPSYWLEGDERALERLIEGARPQQSLQASSGPPDPRLLLRWPATEPLPLLSGDGTEAGIRFALAGPLGLAFRLEGEPGTAMFAADEPAAAFTGRANDRTPVKPRQKPSSLSSVEPVPTASQSGAATGMTATAADSDPVAVTETSESDYLGQFVGSEGGGSFVRETRELNGWSVLLGRSRQWRLDAPAEAVAAASPEIADVQLLAPDVLYVIGKKVGSTSVSVLSRDGLVQKRDVTVELDVQPLRTLLAGDPDMLGVRVLGVARGVALTGEVGSADAAARALQLAAATLPEGMTVESSLRVGLDLVPLRTLMDRESGLQGVRVQRVARGVALTGEVGSQATAERALRLAVASLPEDMVVENSLRVVLDVEPLRTLLVNDPDLRGVKVQALSRGVALTGEVESAAAADLALRFAAASLPEETVLENNMHIAGPKQVNLEVQIAEVKRSTAEDLGINWTVFGTSNDPLGFGFRIGRAVPDQFRMPVAGGDVTWPPGPGPVGPDGSLDVEIPGTIVDGTLSPTFVLQRAWENFGITSMVDALAQAGLANVLARPNVTANSGETASFFSGGEYPLPSGYDDGVIIFEYKKFGVLLDFVPTIVDEGRIELTVRPEVSEPSKDQSIQVHDGVNVPVINVRRAETTVEMADGESIVIAGLFRTTTNEVEAGVPLLKDLPLFGALFGHTSSRSEELELIVTVTARLVQAGPALEAVGTAAAGFTDDHYY